MPDENKTTPAPQSEAPSAAQLWVSRLGLPLLLAIATILVVIYWQDLWSLFSSPERLKAMILASGFWGPAAFIGLQFLQVVVFVIPGEFPQVAGGYVFGFWLGTLLSVTGIALGSVFNFFLARILGLRFVQAVFGKEKVDHFEDLINNPKLTAAFFFLFLIPGLPKDVLCYLAGLSRMKFWTFFLISTTARLPGILGSSFMGHAAGLEQWVPFIIVAVVAIVLFGLGFLFKNQIQDLISKWTHKTDRPQ